MGDWERVVYVRLRASCARNAARFQNFTGGIRPAVLGPAKLPDLPPWYLDYASLRRAAYIGNIHRLIIGIFEILEVANCSSTYMSHYCYELFYVVWQ